WSMNGVVLFELGEGGRGRAEDAPVRWEANNGVLKIVSEDGQVEQVRYELRDGKLFLDMGGAMLPLERRGAQQKAQKPQQPQASNAGKIDQNAPLARLLLSTAWCSFSYSNGTTRKSRVQFHPDGSWSSGGNRETQWSGENGSYYGANGSSAAGQWSVQG